MEHLEEDFEDENLDYEDFLHNAFEICKKAGLEREIVVEEKKVEEKAIRNNFVNQMLT